MTAPPEIVWFRGDLRLDDNPALHAAAQHDASVLPVYVWPDTEDGRVGARQYHWLVASLEKLADALEARGSRLLLLRGPAEKALPKLCESCAAERVHHSRRYEPWALEEEQAVAENLLEVGVRLESHAGNLLHEPGSIETTSGTNYKVFTPFWKACSQEIDVPAPLPAPKKLAAPEQWPNSLPLSIFAKECRAKKVESQWQPGEAGAHAALDTFLIGIIEDYQNTRDLPGVPGTSRLSVHLAFGEISPRQIVHAIRETADPDAGGAEAFVRQLYWREFAYNLLYHEPQTVDEPLRPEFRHFPWKDGKKALECWQQGETGYPYIDAAMRELLHTGWMHNRARMAVASFLVKHLLIPWQEGAAWFWEQLYDADMANNTLGWQWVAGCGADAAPYFRIFNPITQGKKFDEDGAYVRQWVPELATLPDKHLHAPWEAPEQGLSDAGVRLGKNYPKPIVEHKAARERALDAYEGMRVWKAM